MKRGLFFAIGDPSAVATLLKNNKNNLNINWQDNEGNTALHLAINTGNYESAILIMKDNNCRYDLLNNRSETCAMLAAQKGYLTILKYMIKSKKEFLINHKNRNGENIMLYALQNPNENIIKLLIKNKCEINIATKNNKTSTLLEAVKSKNHDIINIILNTHDCHLNIFYSDDAHIIHHMIYNGVFEQFSQILLSLDKFIVNATNKSQQTPLMLLAGMYDDPHYKDKYVDELINDENCRVNEVDINNRSVIYYVNHIIAEKIVNTEYKKKFELYKPDIDGNTWLIWLCSYIHINLFENVILKLLEDENYPINHQNKQGDTALHILLKNNNNNIHRIAAKFFSRPDLNCNLTNLNNEHIINLALNRNVNTNILSKIKQNIPKIGIRQIPRLLCNMAISG